MKTSTEIGSIAKIIGEEKAIEYCAKAGFDAWDFSMTSMCRYDWSTGRLVENDHPLAGENYREYAKHLRRVADENGIRCNQSHAPFPTYCKEVFPYLKRAIECSAIAGAEICVIHPNNFASASENAKMYKSLLPYAKEMGVKIACENMFTWDSERDEAGFAACATAESFLEHYSAVNDDFFTICLDIGHSEMRGAGGGAVKMIKTLGRRIGALHIHDNDGWHDLHQIPGTMDIDFNDVVSALREVNYSGYFTLEANQYLKDYTEENIFEGIKKMADATRYLADMFENNR